MRRLEWLAGWVQGEQNWDYRDHPKLRHQKAQMAKELCVAIRNVSRALDAFESWAHEAALAPEAHPAQRQGIADALARLRAELEHRQPNCCEENPP